MRKLAFIPTREEKESPIKVFLEKSGWEVSLLVNKNSMFEAYTDALKEHKVMADDVVILCHDDIDILMDSEHFNEVIDTNISKKNVGFLGVAGCKELNKTACWWHQMGREFPHPDSFLRGCVLHGDNLNGAYPTYYGGYGKVQVVDGLFLVAKGSTLNSIRTTKPKSFAGDWDFYDIYYTYQADQKGLENLVVPIFLLHNSPGEGALSEEWDKSRKAFVSLYGEKLGDIAMPAPMPSPPQGQQQAQA